MDVLNFGPRVHRARRVHRDDRARRDGRLTSSPNLWTNLGAVLPAMLGRWPSPARSAGRSSACWCRPVYGQHLKQILITWDGIIIGEELIKVVWGPSSARCPFAEGLRGSLLIGLGGDHRRIGKYRRASRGRDLPGRVDLDAAR